MRLNKCLGYACVLSRCSHVWLSATPWTVACQAPLSIEFSRLEYWSGLPCLPPGDLPDPRILGLLRWQTGSLPLASLGKPLGYIPGKLNRILPGSRTQASVFTFFSFIFYTLYPIPQSSKPAFPTNAVFHLVSPSNRSPSKTFQSSPELSSHILHIQATLHPNNADSAMFSNVAPSSLS